MIGYLYMADTVNRQLGSGVIYKIPGMSRSFNTVTIRRPQARFLRLRVINGDNPPLCPCVGSIPPIP